MIPTHFNIDGMADSVNFIKVYTVYLDLSKNCPKDHYSIYLFMIQNPLSSYMYVHGVLVREEIVKMKKFKSKVKKDGRVIVSYIVRRV